MLVQFVQDVNAEIPTDNMAKNLYEEHRSYGTLGLDPQSAHLIII